MTRYIPMALLALAACDTSKDPIDADDLPGSAPKGNLVIELSGGDGEVNSSVEEVWIRFEDVQVKHEDEGWISVASERSDLDLLSLRDGTTEPIGQAETLEGSYDALRVFVADAWVIVDGTEHDLTVTDGIALPDAGITFNESFFVDEGSTTTLLLDWELGSQLSDDEGDWKLGTDADLSVELEDDIDGEPEE